MNIAILHYHLNRGGVTQVVINHLRSLNATAATGKTMRVALLFGGRRQAWPDTLADELPHLEISLHEVPELEYNDRCEAPERLTARLRTTLAELNFTPTNSLLHFHNHSLGKNVATPEALADLARDGFRLLLQIHDFAEDFRPDNFRTMADHVTRRDGPPMSDWLYRQAPQIHYAVLNGRDHRLLSEAGLPESQLHWLPNPVAGVGDLPTRTEARRLLKEKAGVPEGGSFVLYPVRVIRRKNVGELLLLTQLAPPRTTFGVTLPPLNPIERPSFEAWKTLARRRELPVLFDLGETEGVGFRDNLAAADAILTTSVAEGFGMVFLESWLANRPLVGRDLPEISADFKQAGVRYPFLYDRVRVPVDWVGWQRLSDALRSVYESVTTSFGRPPTRRDVFDEALRQLTPDGCIDFAKLPRALQLETIEAVCGESARREELRAVNQDVVGALAAVAHAETSLLEQNANVVRKQYSLISSGRRLRDVYARAISSVPSDDLHPLSDGGKILDAFLRLDRLNAIRIEP